MWAGFPEGRNTIVPRGIHLLQQPNPEGPRISPTGQSVPRVPLPSLPSTDDFAKVLASHYQIRCEKGNSHARKLQFLTTPSACLFFSALFLLKAFAEWPALAQLLGRLLTSSPCLHSPPPPLASWLPWNNEDTLMFNQRLFPWLSKGHLLSPGFVLVFVFCFFSWLRWNGISKVAMTWVFPMANVEKLFQIRISYL